MTPIQSTRPVAETLSYRLANSGLFRFFALWIGAAVAFVIPVVMVLLIIEDPYTGGSRDIWLAILGLVFALIYMVIVGGWLGRVIKRAMRDVDAWATAIGLERTGTTTLSTGLRIDPLSRSGRHRVVAGWSGTYRGHNVEVLHYFVNSGTNKSPEITRNTIIGVTSARPTSHYVEVLPQRRLEDVLVRAGAQDIELGIDDFDRAWRLRADEEQAARALVTPSVAMILARSADVGMRIAWDKSVVVGVTRAHEARTADLARRLDVLVDVAAATPGYSATHASGDGSPKASGVSAAEAAHPRASRKVSTSGMSFLVMLAGFALLLGGSWIWGRFEQPVIGGILAFIGFVIVMKPSPVVGVIDRLRRRS